MTKLHFMPISQPSRAVNWFAKKHNIELEPVLVDVLKGETMSPDFTKLNPLQSIPILEFDDGEVLTESGAILTYLATKHNVTAELPSDALKRARVDEALLNHDGLSRLVTMKALRPFVAKMMNPALPLDEIIKTIKENSEHLIWSLEIVNGKLEKTKYIAGDELTVADYLVICELNQLAVLEPVIGKVDTKLTTSAYPGIQRYLKDAEEIPGYAESAAPLQGLAKALAGAQ